MDKGDLARSISIPELRSRSVAVEHPAVRQLLVDLHATLGRQGQEIQRLQQGKVPQGDHQLAHDRIRYLEGTFASQIVAGEGEPIPDL